MPYSYVYLLTVLFLNQTSYSSGVAIQFRNEEDSEAFHCVFQQWKKEFNVQGAVLEICVNLLVEWHLTNTVFDFDYLGHFWFAK